MLNNKALAASLSAGPKTYIEDVFSTFLYTGNGSSQTITNGIDLSGKGGLVWNKPRSAAGSNCIYDTARGAGKELNSDNSTASGNDTSRLSGFTATGFTLGSGSSVNTNGTTYTSWTFRKAPKFFDVVTWTGDGTNNRAINHSLTTTPRVIIIKRTDSTSNWAVYSPASLWTGESFTGLYLNTTAAVGSTTVNGQGISAVGASSFTVISSGSNPLEFNPNTNGATYVAYLFAHNAGGFGDSGNDNVISCGNYTGNGSTSGPIVTLGWEPQWLLIKRASGGTAGWYIIDDIRGLAVGGSDLFLSPDSSGAEATAEYLTPLSRGFQVSTTSTRFNAGGSDYVYIAIRRGPMKTPTDATKVFNSVLQAASTTPQTKEFGFIVDSLLANPRSSSGFNNSWFDRLRGANRSLFTRANSSESSSTDSLIGFDAQTGIRIGADAGALIQAVSTWVHYAFRRAPGFFDVVAYTGTGSNQTVSHTLSAVPEFMVAKRRNTSGPWAVYAASLGVGSIFVSTGLRLNAADGPDFTNTTRFYQTPTATEFYVGTDSDVNASGSTYIAYLFATCPGVSKVGSYTGTGTTLNVDCGFTNGARFVLIKRTDSTGDWYVWDTARGIISGNDPYLLLNSTAAEVTNTDYIDPLSSGFQISSTAPAAINASGGSYIYLSVA